MARLRAVTDPEGLPELRSVTIHGHRRAYRDVGPRDAPVIVLVHGIGDRSESWSPVMPALARDHRVVAPDLLGHGGSAKPRGDYSIGGFANGVRDLLTVLGIDRATVVGHSLGGGVAMQFAYQHPERCERLVLVAAGGVSRRVHVGLRALTLPGTALTLAALRPRVVRRGAHHAARWLARFDGPTGRDAHDLLRVLEGLPDVAARTAFVRTLRSVVDVRGQVVTMLDRAYLASQLPTLLIWGDGDVVVPVHDAHVAHAAVPGSRLEIVAGAGHFPHRSHAAHVATIVEDFLATTRPAEHDREVWRRALRDGATAASRVSVAHLDGAS